jgi:hypothetical protein
MGNPMVLNTMLRDYFGDQNGQIAFDTFSQMVKQNLPPNQQLGGTGYQTGNGGNNGNMYGGGSMMGGGMGMQNPYLQNNQYVQMVILPLGIDPSSPYDLFFTKRNKGIKKMKKPECVVS